MPDQEPDKQEGLLAKLLSTARRNYAASSAGCGVPNLAINLVFV